MIGGGALFTAILTGSCSRPTVTETVCDAVLAAGNFRRTEAGLNKIPPPPHFVMSVEGDRMRYGDGIRIRITMRIIAIGIWCRDLRTNLPQRQQPICFAQLPTGWPLTCSPAQEFRTILSLPCLGFVR